MAAAGARDADGSPDLSDPNWLVRHAVSPAVTGCERLVFDPSFSLTPDTTQAGAPSGDHPIQLKIPQTNVASELATPELKNVVLTAPQGVTLNPGAADGLQGCTDAQFDVSSTSLAGCPLASRVGTVQVKTPLLADPLQGEIFVRRPDCAPCNAADAAGGRIFGLFLQILGPGVVVKQPVSVAVDPSTGQITATVQGTPQLPFSDLTLNLDGGARAIFINPATCGTARSDVDLTPWSSGGSSGTSDAALFSTFDVDWDGAGGGCPGALPFAPSFLAQTSTPLAGAFSPFTVNFGKADRQTGLPAEPAYPAGVARDALQCPVVRGALGFPGDV